MDTDARWVWLETAPRLNRTWTAFLLLYVVWGVGVLVVHFYNQSAAGLDRPLELCPMKLATGLPCPTCGSTRATLSLVSVHIFDAWRHNPLASVGIPAISVVVFLRIALGRAVRVRLSPGTQRIVWVCAAVAVLGNWAWVIWDQAR